MFLEEPEEGPTEEEEASYCAMCRSYGCRCDDLYELWKERRYED